MSDRTINVFVSYSHQDTEYLERDSLLGFLRGLEKDDIVFWTDKRINPGEFWDEVIKTNIQKTDIALILVSQGFLDSDYCQNIEIKNFLAKKAHVFPVILSPCDWQRHDWLKSRQFMPNLDDKGREQTIEEHFQEAGKRKRLFTEIRQKLLAQATLIRQAPLALPDNKELTNALKRKMAYINRGEQWDSHIESRIIETNNKTKTFAFVVAGVFEEWPDAIKMRLCQHINLEENKATKLELKIQGKRPNERTEAIWKAFLDKLNIPSEDQQLPRKQQLIKALSDVNQPSILFYWKPNSGIKAHFHPDTIKDLVTCWESLSLGTQSNPHYLMIIHDSLSKSASFTKGLWESWQAKRWRSKVERAIDKGKQDQHDKIVTAILKSPTHQDMMYWLDDNKDWLLEKELYDLLEQKIIRLKRRRMPHRTLTTHLLN